MSAAQRRFVLGVLRRACRVPGASRLQCCAGGHDTGKTAGFSKIRGPVTRPLLVVLIMIAVAFPAVRADARPRSYFITPTWGRPPPPRGWRADPFRPAVRQHHWGIDIAAAHGTPVVASAAGTVQYAGAYAGYGSTVYVYHGAGWAAR